MDDYEFKNGAFGAVFSENEIQYNGQSITTIDRKRIHARCGQCGHHWTPSSDEDFETCPKEDTHDYDTDEQLADLVDQYESGLLNDDELEERAGDIVADEFDVTDLVDEVNPPYRVKHEASYVEEYHFPDGRVVTASYQPVIRCQHCDYEWGTASNADRPSCASCHRKTDRNVIGKHYEAYLKYALFNGEESSAGEVSNRLRDWADRVELMTANGWRFDCTTQSSHVLLSKGDAPQQELIA